MEWNVCMSMLQEYLENRPLIVLGSGASMPYGLPSMGILAEEIKKSAIVISDPNYGTLCTAIDSLGLESAIDSVALLPQTLNAIRCVVWKTVNENDLSYFDRNSVNPPQALADLIRKVLAPTPNKAVIVTTNYDRLAEYSADGVGATTVTGFEGTLIKKLELPVAQLRMRRTRARERVVDIWKVHGSLDWFIAPDGTVAAFPLSRKIPDTFQPLIIPPGKEKYSTIHDEPYRTMIAEADNAFVQAGAYLCIGYGFNDEHIQPKLLTQISKGKPIVVLARTMTAACRKHIVDAGIQKYLVFENADDLHTKVYGNGWEETYEGQYWLLDNFLNIW
ncbi:MAG: SIR2 family protein [Phascolarctobacterium sp.]|uniref:SIR2 family protein n=1 Tax=Phascolarctobacterium sp. TaxID=2049039 RepID=UPI0026DC536B|nr:SIR2 family protein [Phascolarctobacterium sp.]MDO4921353.1 SIR2 family protein [Phascolarctobacterium sp.]